LSAPRPSDQLDRRPGPTRRGLCFARSTLIKVAASVILIHDRHGIRVPTKRALRYKTFGRRHLAQWCFFTLIRQNRVSFDYDYIKLDRKVQDRNSRSPANP